MNLPIRKISLRTRLYLLAAMVFIALFIAAISAYRTAQTSAAYTVRQAEINVNLAAREIARETSDFEAGRGDYGANRRMPPHLREINARYSDEFSRIIAAGLHRFEDISGGFCTANDELKGTIFVQSYSADELSQIKNICREISTNDVATTKKIEISETTLIIAVSPIENSDLKNNSIDGIFAVRQNARTNIFADRFNLLTQLFLLISIIVSAILAFLTLRDWRSGMFKIEAGLNAISGDLSSRIDEPQIAELNHISREINNLAQNLESNITRQKQLENDLARNEKLAALGRVASGVAHEVRNPLASMKLKIQLAERHKSDEGKLEKTFDVLLEEIERLDNLVRKLLDVSRPSKLNFAGLNLGKLLERRISLIKEKADTSGIKIKNLLAESIETKADGEKLAQVFDNLLLNGIEAMPDGGILIVSAKQNAEKIVVTIEDNGAGISAEAKIRLFEPFFTTKDKGTGLGLAISREIIEAHSGKLYAAETEKGAKFIIELPMQKAEKQ